MALIPTLLLTAVAFPFMGIGGQGGDPGPAPPAGDSATATARPESRILATGQGIELSQPIAGELVTAMVLSSPSSASARELSVADGVDYHDLTGDGPATGLSVGAPAGTPVYAPIDGVISSVADYAVAGRVEGYEVTIEPLIPSSAAVRITRLHSPAGDRPAIGSGVSAGRTVIGRVHDLSHVTEQTLARFTADAGNHVQLEVIATGVAPGT